MRSFFWGGSRESLASSGGGGGGGGGGSSGIDNDARDEALLRASFVSAGDSVEDFACHRSLTEAPPHVTAAGFVPRSSEGAPGLISSNQNAAYSRTFPFPLLRTPSSDVAGDGVSIGGGGSGGGNRRDRGSVARSALVMTSDLKHLRDPSLPRRQSSHRSAVFLTSLATTIGLFAMLGAIMLMPVRRVHDQCWGCCADDAPCLVLEAPDNVRVLTNAEVSFLPSEFDAVPHTCYCSTVRTVSDFEADKSEFVNDFFFNREESQGEKDTSSYEHLLDGNFDSFWCTLPSNGEHDILGYSPKFPDSIVFQVTIGGGDAGDSRDANLLGSSSSAAGSAGKTGKTGGGKVHGGGGRGGEGSGSTLARRARKQWVEADADGGTVTVLTRTVLSQQQQQQQQQQRGGGGRGANPVAASLPPLPPPPPPPTPSTDEGYDDEGSDDDPYASSEILGVRLRVSEYNQCAAKAVQLQHQISSDVAEGILSFDDDRWTNPVLWQNLTGRVTLCCTNSWQYIPFSEPLTSPHFVTNNPPGPFLRLVLFESFGNPHRIALNGVQILATGPAPPSLSPTASLEPTVPLRSSSKPTHHPTSSTKGPTAAPTTAPSLSPTASPEPTVPSRRQPHHPFDTFTHRPSTPRNDGN